MSEEQVSPRGGERLRPVVDELGAALASLVNAIEARPYRTADETAIMRARKGAVDVLIKYGFGA